MSSHNSGREYEIVVEKIIDKLNSVKEQLHLGKIEGEQRIKGKSGEWHMEVVAYDAGNGKPVLVECKHWSRKIPRDILAGLAYKIKDVGGERGIIVSTLGLQKGALDIAKHENIEVIILKREATSDNYDLVLPSRGRHHVGMSAVVKFKEELRFIGLSKRKKSKG